MFTDVYIGRVKSENFDYEKPGSPYGYSPDYALESLKVGNKPHLRGSGESLARVLDNGFTN